MKWKDQIEERAKKFSRKMEEEFRKCLGETQNLIPSIFIDEEQDKMNKMFHLNTPIDYMMATTVAIACKYVSDDEDFEKLFLEAMGEKFKQIRDMRKKGLLS